MKIDDSNAGVALFVCLHNSNNPMNDFGKFISMKNVFQFEQIRFAYTLVNSNQCIGLISFVINSNDTRHSSIERL